MLLECLFFSMTGVTAPAGTGDLEVPMNHKRYRDWTIELPKESFTSVGEAITLANGKYTFKAGMEGTNLLLDLNGDGETDVRIDGDEGSALLRHEDGFRYAIRLKRGPDGWSFACSGAQVGKLDGQKISLIDQDNDGIFGEAGEDAILMGQGKIATWLGNTILLDGVVHALELDEAGSQLRLAPYVGELGSLSVAAGFQGNGKLLSAVVKSTDGKHCFDLASVEGPVQVPVGKYRIVSGKIGLGEQAVMLAPGSTQPVSVTAQAEQEIVWGGPVRAEFEFQRQGAEVAFSPEFVWYYGASGEEYLNWKPVGKSPVFRVVDKVNSLEVARAVFPGSC